MNPPPRTISQRLQQQAHALKDAVALYQQGAEALSFEGLWLRVRSMALVLRQKGLMPQERVVVLLPPGLHFLLVNYALLTLGAVPVLIDPGMGLRGFLRCVQQAQPSYLIGSPKALVLSLFFKKAFSSLKGRWSVGACLKPLAVEPEWIEPSTPESGAILFTSGSTGPAKGVWFTQRQILAQAEAIASTYAMQPGEVDLPLLAAFALYSPLIGMATVFPKLGKPSDLDPQKILDLLDNYRVSSSFGSPVLWQKIADYCKAKNKEIKYLRRILIAGAPLPPALVRALRVVAPYASVHSPYGATEALPVTTVEGAMIIAETASQTEQGRGTCVGYPVKGMAVRIGAPDSDAASPFQVGDIWVSGPCVSTHYITADPSQGKAIHRVLWHRMGDLGYRDACGRLWFCGRAAEAVHAHGTVFYTDCCESVFNALPGVQRSALIAYRCGATCVPAIVIEGSPSWLAKKQLLARLRAQAALFAHTRLISTFFFMRRFPVDARHNAKIHRLAMAKRFEGR